MGQTSADKEKIDKLRVLTAEIGDFNFTRYVTNCSHELGYPNNHAFYAGFYEAVRIIREQEGVRL